MSWTATTQITRALAVGGSGLCYLAREIDDHGEPQPPDLAIKVLYAERYSGPFLRRLATEAQILQDLNHENIVECRGFVHRSGHAPYLITLYERGGSLADYVDARGPLPPVIAAGVLRQILLALSEAHQRGVVHRDLKPQNVLLREQVEDHETPRVRVVDFGIAKVAGSNAGLTTVGSFVGTPEYAAPEQFAPVNPPCRPPMCSPQGPCFY
jgi:serine/threonine-protein kinase